jgi:transcriptional regulator with XRE-family HTH domain
MDIGPFMGSRIKELREERGLAQETLSKRAGLGINAINRYEHGARVPNAAAVAKIAEALGVPPGELFPKGGAPRGPGQPEEEPAIALAQHAMLAQLQQERQAAARALSSDRPQVYFARHENEALLRLSRRHSEELADALLQATRRALEAEAQLALERSQKAELRRQVAELERA